MESYHYHKPEEYHVLTEDFRMTFCDRDYTTLPQGTGIMTLEGYRRNTDKTICLRCKEKICQEQ